MITQERLKELLHYCPVSGLFTWINPQSNRVGAGDRAGCVNHHGYLTIGIDATRYRAARIAFLYMEGVMPDEFIDHINHNRLDDRWLNLRPVSHIENSRNHCSSKANTSGYTGVVWYKRDSCWQAKITVDYKTLHLGYFKDKDKAIGARKAANIKYGYHPNHGAKKG